MVGSPNVSRVKRSAFYSSTSKSLFGAFSYNIRFDVGSLAIDSRDRIRTAENGSCAADSAHSVKDNDDTKFR